VRPQQVRPGDEGHPVAPPIFQAARLKPAAKPPHVIDGIVARVTAGSLVLPVINKLLGRK